MTFYPDVQTKQKFIDWPAA